ncbi:MAG TPA: tRNA (adenosine(37)-N6)-dimethylallyltransferase MiaA [Candidatus Pacearchaeota archaeon]|nr:tRNA (adenosine(37)-N6)-dimethylallyltransferase MiaA [Candidatus Pacearchaeota archaeon]
MKKENKKIIVILGPTASGKSELAVKVARWLSTEKSQKKFGIKGAEIISADSRQVYKGMDIGTGKITKKEMQGIPHHLLDVASPKRKFTVVQYRKFALRAMNKILKKDKIPILCGGTGFYIKAVIDGIYIPPVPPDWKLRKELEKKSPEELYKMLKKLDPERAKTIEKKNKRRLIRAIEIVEKLGKVPPFEKNPLPYPVLMLGIKKDKEELKILIKKRLKKRLREGMVDEVKKLKESGVSWQRLEEFGLEYKWIARYLQNKITYQQMFNNLEKDIEGYARRQMTWFNHQFDDFTADQRIYWVKNYEESQNLIKDFLEKNKGKV